MALHFKTVIKFSLRRIGLLIPDIPKIRALGSRVLWPIHRTLELGGGIVNVMGVKMKLDPNEFVDRGLWFTPQLYDKYEINFALKNLKSTGTFIDAGANIGFWSIRIAKEKPDIQVIAIEPNPNTADILEENIALNNLKNIRVLRKGLAGKVDKLKLFCYSHGNRGGDSFKFHYTHASAQEVMVEVLPLQDLCRDYKIEKIDLIKMDIEGMEVGCIPPRHK